MNIVIVGLGSMGRRRIRLIKKYSDNFRIIGIDTNEERRKSTENEFGIETNGDLIEVISSNLYNCAFICTSPITHSKLIYECLEHNLHIFSELNLVIDGYDENIQLAKDKNRILFLSSTFLYRAEIIKIKSLISKHDKKSNYTYHVGQYLPDWHPWESYKDFFVSDIRTNACREILAIELPWIIETFGNVKDIYTRKSKISSLDIDYNDNYMIILEHSSGHKGMLTVDVVSRKAVRNLEIINEDLYLSWDGSADGLKMVNLESKVEETITLYDKVDQLDQYSKFVVENAYYDEIETFFDAIINKVVPNYNFEKDKIVLELIDRIEA